MEESTANGRAKFAATDGEQTAALEVATIEGRFPKWRDVVPANRPRVSHFTFQDVETSDSQTVGGGQYNDGARKLRAETETYDGHPRGAVVKVCLNAKMLAELARAIDDAACNGDDNRAVELIVPLDPTQAVVLQRENVGGVTVRGVLMPLHS
jgi:hypothetical protein